MNPVTHALTSSIRRVLRTMGYLPLRVMRMMALATTLGSVLIGFELVHEGAPGNGIVMLAVGVLALFVHAGVSAALEWLGPPTLLAFALLLIVRVDPAEAQPAPGAYRSIKIPFGQLSDATTAAMIPAKYPAGTSTLLEKPMARVIFAQPAQASTVAIQTATPVRKGDRPHWCYGHWSFPQ